MFDFHHQRFIKPQLTVDEANIILMNIRTSNPSGTISIREFQFRLENLLRHTPDSCLCGSIRSLHKKITQMSQQEFDQLCRDTNAGKIMFPPNYTLPSIQ